MNPLALRLASLAPGNISIVPNLSLADKLRLLKTTAGDVIPRMQESYPVIQREFLPEQEYIPVTDTRPRQEGYPIWRQDYAPEGVPVKDELREKLRRLLPGFNLPPQEIQPKRAIPTYVGESAKGWEDLPGKFSPAWGDKPRAEISDLEAVISPKSMERIYRGGDSDLRFRNDMAIRLGVPPSKIPENEMRIFPLKDALIHPKLFEKYPYLKDVMVNIRDLREGMGGAMGQWDKTHKLISVSSLNQEGNPASPDEVLSTLLHEIQHAIQEKEGWARGGSPSEFYPSTSESQSQAEWSLESISDALDKGKDEAQIWDKQGKYTIRGKDTLLQIRKELIQNLKDINPLSKYQRLAGEIEARDTASRKNLSLEERMKQIPYRSQGIPLKDVIIKRR